MALRRFAAWLMSLVMVGVLGGCASSTQLITNEKASDTIKAKSFKAYREVLLIPPKDDPRQLVPRIVKEIEGMGFQVRLMDPNQPIDPPQGTGFVVGADGSVLTCAHVMGEKTEATVTLGHQRVLADVVKSDTKADLALLKLREPLPAQAAVLSFRGAARPAAMGEDVYTIGYPLSRMLGNNARMTRGLLSATTGLRDDAQQVQVSAEIQPGNSGGPLLDREGQVIGVVARTLNPAAVAQATGGALPQNVNFAIKHTQVIDFLKVNQPPLHASLAYDRPMPLDKAGQAVAKIQAGIVGPDADRNDKMVVRFAYVSMWDVWYRFRLFMLAAFDYETQEGLFIAGQGRDNLVSNEEVVIRDTLEQFRKAIASR